MPKNPLHDRSPILLQHTNLTVREVSNDQEICPCSAATARFSHRG
jgi:hypothetical protein